VEQQPPVLGRQGQGLHPVHEGAGVVCASSCTGRFEDCGADGGACGEKAVGSVVHAKPGGDRHRGGCVLRVNCELVGLNTETEGGGEGCQDLEGPHGGLSGCIYMLVVPGISRSIEHAPSFQVFATECVEQSYGLRYLSSKDFSCCMIALCEQSLRFSIWHRVLCVTECIRVE
jgi:hypothetical protein